MLKITDRIYGQITIDNSTILKIINTPAFQRLKRINQFGGVNFIFPQYQVSRYEHSIGVWWVLKRLNFSFEIQVAGLLHDIAHSAFAHMIDLARKDKNENFHEEKLTDFSMMEPINKILDSKKIKLDLPDKYPEIKKSLPDVGADRIDYAIRDYYGALGKTTDFGEKVLAQIEVKGRDLLFTDKEIAKKYSLKGLEAMWRVIYEPKVAVVYQALAEILRVGFDQKWITEKDIMQDDLHVFSIIKEHKDDLPEKYMNIFELPYSAKIVKKGEPYDFFHIKLKARYFNPAVETRDGIKRLSEIDPEFAKTLEEKVKIFEERKKGVYIKVNFSNI